MICVHCERKREPSKQDPEFCQKCYSRIEIQWGLQMERSRAAVAFLNARNNDPKLKVAAFMAIFHPEVPHSKVREIMNAIR